MKSKWQRNIWTGDDILNLDDKSRVIRSGKHLYRVEYWGDYSLKYPIKGPFESTLKGALSHLDSLKKG